MPPKYKTELPCRTPYSASSIGIGTVVFLRIVFQPRDPYGRFGHIDVSNDRCQYVDVIKFNVGNVRIERRLEIFSIQAAVKKEIHSLGNGC